MAIKTPKASPQNGESSITVVSAFISFSRSDSRTEISQGSARLVKAESCKCSSTPRYHY